MKIVILNGSPKGDLSVTMQYVHFIQKKIPQHEYAIINVSQRIKQLEKNEEAFSEIIKVIDNSDGVIWGFPTYYFLVPSQYKRFIELIYERNAQEAFKDNYSIILTTSAHIFDHTSVNYIHSICDDLNMKYVDFFSADMNDLLEEAGRKRLIQFFKNFIKSIENNYPTVKYYSSLNHREFVYSPSLVDMETNKVKSNGKKILLVVDSLIKDSNLGKMIQRLQNCVHDEIEIINLDDVKINGGCFGCLKCAYNNQCEYDNKDDFRELWLKKINPADILFMAGIIKDRYLSSKWKMMLDRSFFTGHIPSMRNKQIGYVISGPLSQIPNLREQLKAYAEAQNSNLVDIITDEFGTSEDIDFLLMNFIRKSYCFSKLDYLRPKTFYTIAGSKHMRYLLYSDIRFLFQADHDYYKKHGLYDFPKKSFVSRVLKQIFKVKRFRKALYKNQGLLKKIIKPYQKILDKYV